MGGGRWGETKPVKGRSLVRMWLDQSAEVTRLAPSLLSTEHSLIRNPTCWWEEEGEGSLVLVTMVVCKGLVIRSLT